MNAARSLPSTAWQWGILIPAITSFYGQSVSAGEIPQPVRAMIEEAIRQDDPAKVDAIISIARATNPASAGEIDALREDYRHKRERLATQEAERDRAELASTGIFENWRGKGEFGAFRATGNSSNIGISVALTADRKGIDWEHQVRGRFDYQKDRAVEREQYLLAYRPRYTIAGDTFAFGLAQFERDPFQGYDARYSLSGGFGYRVFQRDDLRLAVEAGPAVRRTTLVVGNSEDQLSGRGSLDFEVRLAKALKLTQDASAYLDPVNSTFNSVTALEAGVSDGLVARLSYAVEYETDPGPFSVETDTMSRFSLVYGF